MTTTINSGSLFSTGFLRMLIPVLAITLAVSISCSQAEPEEKSFPSGDSSVPMEAPPAQVSEENSTSDATKKDEPFLIVEEMPSFPGGLEALLQYVSDNINYPEKAKENNIEGRVVVRFCIERDGSVGRINIFNSVDPDLDKEAARVVSILPDFIPGKQEGKAVPVWFLLPVPFTLK